nr:hypothetical protein Iba_chr04cCG11970 [Ipomoea batatas]
MQARRRHLLCREAFRIIALADNSSNLEVASLLVTCNSMPVEVVTFQNSCCMLVVNILGSHTVVATEGNVEVVEVIGDVTVVVATSILSVNCGAH